jgi:hypothetical protein
MIKTSLVWTMMLLVGQYSWGINTDQTLFTGFGTFGASVIDSNERFNDFGTEEYNSTSFTRDSKIGFNVTKSLGGSKRFAFQTVMLGDRNSFSPEVDLAFLASKIDNTGFEILMGRVVAPIWLYSEEQSIGYNSPWIRPPTLLYSTATLRNADGAGIRYVKPMADGVLSVQVIYGASAFPAMTTQTIPNGSGGLTKANIKTHVKIDDLVASEIRYDRNSWTFRIGYSRSRTATDIVTTTLGVPNVGIYSSVKHKNGEMKSVGLNGTFGNSVFATEYANLAISPDNINYFEGGYFSYGYKMGDWTPFVTYSQKSSLDGANFTVTNDPLGQTKITKSEAYAISMNYYGFENIVVKTGVTSFIESYNRSLNGSDKNDFNVYTILTDIVF